MIYQNMTEIIGKTPLVELKNFANRQNVRARLVAHPECLNPCGSVKDRTAFSMIAAAEESGRINCDTLIIEPTSGNTGIGLAAICAVRGYRLALTMPETMSVERRKLLRAYGAEIILTDGKKGMQGAIDAAQELAARTPNSFIPAQFENPANPRVHRETTGPEIWKDIEGDVDIFVAGVGTGGTITGAGEYLKSRKESVYVVAVEPKTSSVLRGENAGAHGIQGIGAGFVPAALNVKVFDEVIAVSDDSAYECARLLAKTEGLLVGISSGAALAAACEVAARAENAGKTIVVLLPDSGDRYLSTPLFSE